MNYLNEKNHYDNCRFCWMCRQVCTVATMTNDETQSPRSRALALYAYEKDVIEFNHDFAEAMYKCCLCGYCHSWCEGDFDPEKFIIATRRDAVNLDLEPVNVKTLRDTILEYGNVFGDKVDAEFKKAWDGLSKQGDIVVLAGGVIPYKAVNIAKSALTVFEKLGVKVAGIEETTGVYELYSLGYYDLAVENAKKLIDEIHNTKAQTVITLDTQERYLLNNLEELFGLKLNAKVVDFSEFIVDKKVTFSKKQDTGVTYHDDSYLARKCDIIEEPRDILSAIYSSNFVEMLWLKEEAHATPTALYSVFDYKIAQKMVDRRINDFKETNTDSIIVSSATDYYNMKMAGVSVISLVECVNQAL